MSIGTGKFPAKRICAFHVKELIPVSPTPQKYYFGNYCFFP